MTDEKPEPVTTVPDVPLETPPAEQPEEAVQEDATSTPEQAEAPEEKNEEPTAQDDAESVEAEFMKSEAPAPAEEPEEAAAPVEEAAEEEEQTTHIYALRTTANREDQVLSFVGSNAARKKIPVYAAIAPHGMRGYIFLEAADIQSAEQAAQGVPYAKGVIAKEIEYKEIEHMLEQVKKEIKIQKNDIVEIISGPFKREQAKISRVDKTKEEVVVELLEAAVPIPITLKLDDVKVIRREEE